MKYTIKEIILTVAVVVFGTVSILNAAPTATPPGNNVPTPLYTFLSTFAQPQSKAGTLVSGDAVKRVLSLRTSSLPGSNKTLDANGVVHIGTLTSSTDAFSSLADSTSTGLTSVFKTSSGSTDGNVIITSTNPSLSAMTACIQQVGGRNLIVIC